MSDGVKSWTPGPWRACREGECTCGQVWSAAADSPVATVISGEWGDQYPALRFVEGETNRVEAYMERLDYGRVPEEHAKANIRLIASAPSLYEALEDAAAELDEALSEHYYKCHSYMSEAEYNADPTTVSLRATIAKARDALSRAQGGA